MGATSLTSTVRQPPALKLNLGLDKCVREQPGELSKWSSKTCCCLCLWVRMCHRHYWATGASDGSDGWAGLALVLLYKRVIWSQSQPWMMGWSSFHSCSNAHPYPLAVVLLLQLAQEQLWKLGLCVSPCRGVFLVTVNIPNIKGSLFSLQSAILTSYSYKSPGLLIITITHLTELLTSFPVGIEREGFFSTLGGEASPNCHCDGRLGWWHRGPLSPQLVPVTLGTRQNIQPPLCCPKTLPGRVSHCREDSQEISADRISLNVPANIPWVCCVWCCLCSCRFPTQWSSAPWNTLVWLEGRRRAPVPHVASNRLFCSVPIRAVRLLSCLLGQGGLVNALQFGAKPQYQCVNIPKCWDLLKVWLVLAEEERRIKTLL